MANFTPIPTSPKQAANAETFNAPMSELDTAIGDRTTLPARYATYTTSIVAALGKVDTDLSAIAGTTANTFTINNDLSGSPSLVFGRSPANATLSWSGSFLTLDKSMSVTGTLSVYGDANFVSSTSGSWHLVQTTNGSNTAAHRVMQLCAYTTDVAHGSDGMGGYLDLVTEVDSGNGHNVAQIKWTAEDATAATSTGGLELLVNHGSGVASSAIKMVHDFTEVRIGFFGVTPVVRQTHLADLSVAYTTGDLDTEAEVISAINTTNGKINSIMAALENYGLLKTS
jgi:hypothetical protein